MGVWKKKGGRKKTQLTVAAWWFPLVFLPNKSKTRRPKREGGKKTEDYKRDSCIVQFGRGSLLSELQAVSPY